MIIDISTRPQEHRLLLFFFCDFPTIYRDDLEGGLFVSISKELDFTKIAKIDWSNLLILMLRVLGVARIAKRWVFDFFMFNFFSIAARGMRYIRF